MAIQTRQSLKDIILAKLAELKHSFGSQNTGAYINEQTRQSIPLGVASRGYNTQGQPITTQDNTSGTLNTLKTIGQTIKTSPVLTTSSTPNVFTPLVKGIEQAQISSQKAAEPFHKLPPLEQMRQVNGYLFDVPIKFIYSALQAPKIIQSTLQGKSISTETPVPKWLKFLTDSNTLTSFQQDATAIKQSANRILTQKFPNLSVNTKENLSNGITFGLTALQTILAGAYTKWLGQMGAEYLQSFAPEEEHIAAWATLGYPKNASEIKTNYYNLTHEFYGEFVLGGDNAKIINNAYEILGHTGVPDTNIINTTLGKIGKALLSSPTQTVGILTGVPQGQVIRTQGLLPSQAGYYPTQPYQPIPQVVPVGLSTKQIPPERPIEPEVKPEEIITTKFTKTDKGVQWQVFLGDKERASAIVRGRGRFNTLRQNAEQEARDFINWLKGTTEYKQTVKEVKPAGATIQPVQNALPESQDLIGAKDSGGNTFIGITKEGDKYVVNYNVKRTGETRSIETNTLSDAISWTQNVFNRPATYQGEETIEPITSVADNPQVNNILQQLGDINDKLADLETEEPSITIEAQREALLNKRDKLQKQLETITSQSEQLSIPEQPPKVVGEVGIKPEVKPEEGKSFSQLAKESLIQPPTQPPTRLPIQSQRVAEQYNVPENLLEKQPIVSLKQSEDITTQFVKGLSTDQIEDYLNNPETLKPEIDKPKFRDLLIQNNINNPEVLVHIANSPLSMTISEAGRELRQQKEVVEGSYGYYLDKAQDAKEQFAQHKLNLQNDTATKNFIDTSTDKVLTFIKKALDKGLETKNVNLIQDIISGKIDLLSLMNASQEERVLQLSPYFDNAALTQKAALELEGKQLLKHISLGLKNWALKYGNIQHLSDLQVEKIVDTTAQNLILKNSISDQRHIINDFIKQVTGLGLSAEDTDSLSPYISSMVDNWQKAKLALSEYAANPEQGDTSEPYRKSFAIAKLAYDKNLAQLSGKDVSVPIWVKDLFITLKHRPLPDDSVIIFNEISKLAISMKAGPDISYPGRQGLFSLFTHPDVWLQGAKDAGKVWLNQKTPEGYTVLDLKLIDIYSSPLYFNGFYSNIGLMRFINERFPDSIVTHLPFMGHIYNLSDQAYSIGTLSTRQALADWAWKELQNKEITENGITRNIDFLNNKIDAKNLSILTDVSTASGVQARKGILDTVIWSKNLLWTEINTFLNAVGFKGVGQSQLTGWGRAATAKQAWANIIGRLILVLAAGQFLKAVRKDKSVNELVLNPLDQKFGRIYLGKDIYYADPLLSVLRYASTLLTGKYQSATTRKWHNTYTEFGQYTMDTAFNFLMNKFTPMFGITAQVINHRFYGGERLSVGRGLLHLFAPFTVENIKDLTKLSPQQQVAGMTGILADIIGLNTNLRVNTIPYDYTVRKEISRLQDAGYENLQTALFSGFKNEYPSLTIKENQEFFQLFADRVNPRLLKGFQSEWHATHSDKDRAEAIEKFITSQYDQAREAYFKILLEKHTNQSGEELDKYVKNLIETHFITREMANKFFDNNWLPLNLQNYLRTHRSNK